MNLPAGDFAATLIAHAGRAPSSHNTQPWRFRVDGSALDLFADRTRALPVNDPDDRELTISCGAALLNLRVAAAHAGRHAAVHMLPRAGDADWLAHVDLSNVLAPVAADALLFDEIERRRTYRRPFGPQPVAPKVMVLLAAAAAEEGAWLRPVVAERARRAVATLVAEGDARQWANPGWRRELAFWMHARRRGDGLALPGLAVPVAQLVVRTFDMGANIGAKDRQLAEAAPLLAVLETNGDDAGDWLAAGQALERVLLTACRHGLQASYLNQPIQDPTLRPRLRDLAGVTGVPQLLLRFGHATEDVPAAPRRAVAEVLD